MPLTNLEFCERKVYSQNGEDGILDALFASIGVTNRFFVEFGCEDAMECNTAYLLGQGWQGLLMDGACISGNPKVTVQNEFITAENINWLLQKYSVPPAFDLLSIDIDGNDYWVWQAITYPHTLVILYAKEKPASLTTTLDIPTRTLAAVTLMKSASLSTSGHGHQDARTATGAVTFYNGQNTPQTIPVGTVLTGQDGVKITTDQPALVPAANLPNVGVVTIVASAIQAGSKGNIAPYDINFALTSVLTVKNQTSFTNGRDARDFQAVALTDIDSVTAQVTHMLSSSFQTAFTLHPGEQAQPTNCHLTTTANHKVGDEAQTVTINGSETCSAVAYSQSQLHEGATRQFTTQTKPGARYQLAGSLTSQIISVSPLTVSLSGSWVYVFSNDEQESLAEAIQGDTPAQARRYLLSTGVISSASVPDTLPSAVYIQFLVLRGK